MDTMLDPTHTMMSKDWLIRFRAACGNEYALVFASELVRRQAAAASLGIPFPTTVCNGH